MPRAPRAVTSPTTSASQTASASPSAHHLRILTAIRRILRRVEIGSAELEISHGITIPQLICLRTIIERERCTQVDLSRAVHLGASTLVGVIDRLEAKGLVRRTRDRVDRRRVFLTATPAGRRKSSTSPEPMQDRLVSGIGALPRTRQEAIATAIEQLVDLLDAQGIEPAPILASGPIPKPADLEGWGR